MSIRDTERREALQQAESSGEDLAHQQWLDAIGTAYKRVTGEPWDTLDGETAKEGVDVNVGALFQWFGDELERLRKQNAAMRWALSAFVNTIDDHVNKGGAFPLPNTIHLMAEGHSALQPDAGAHYLSPEQVRPLVEAIRKARVYCIDGTIAWEMDEALAHAKTIGL